jgi:squalene synthase HpnC
VDNRAAVSVDHYENFPVASVLCPPALRPAVAAIYQFARTADDLADEGGASPQARRADLQAYRDDLVAIYADAPASARWAGVFEALARARRAHDLPARPLHDLLDAFVQDTGDPRYEDRQALLDYCRRSANPVGRLLLHLYGIADARALMRSDAICSALQLVNFWQDLSVDLPRGRVYLPAEAARRHGVDLSAPHMLVDTAATKALVRELCEWTDGLMRQGAPLACELPGRVGWELRLVVQGGLRILEKIRQMGYATIRRRPALSRIDVLPLGWHALSMCRDIA